MIIISEHKNIAAPATAITKELLNHEQLGRFFDAKFSLHKAQNPEEITGGKGSVRQVTIGPVKFFEQIISANEQQICYQIIGNGPVTCHKGTISLSPSDKSTTNTHVHYHIQFKGPGWLPDFILKYVVQRDIKSALSKLAEYFQ